MGETENGEHLGKLTWTLTLLGSGYQYEDMIVSIVARIVLFKSYELGKKWHWSQKKSVIHCPVRIRNYGLNASHEKRIRMRLLDHHGSKEGVGLDKLVVSDWSPLRFSF